MTNGWSMRCAIVALTIVTQTATTQMVPLPLVVEGTNLKGTELFVSVFNRGPKTITAWGVRAHLAYPGGVRRSVGITIDGYEAAVLTRKDSPVLPSNARHTIKMVVPRSVEPGDVLVVAEPSFVIFDDDTALGDDRLVSVSFQDRALNARVWRMFETILQDAKTRATDAASVLRTAELKLSEIDDSQLRASPAFVEIQHALALGLNPRYKNDHGRLLTDMLRDAPARHAVAESRATRRD